MLRSSVDGGGDDAVHLIYTFKYSSGVQSLIVGKHTVKLAHIGRGKMAFIFDLEDCLVDGRIVIMIPGITKR